MNTALKSARFAVLSTLASALIIFGSMASAYAHDELISTDPAAEQTLTEAPDEVSMTFSGNITELAGANQVRVTDAEGNDVTRGEVKVDGTRVSQKITGHGSEDQTYTVTWRVVSSDGHPIQGTYQLTVGAGKTATATATETAGAEVAEDGSQKQGSGVNATNIVIFGAATLAVIALLMTVILKHRSRNT